MTETLPYLAWPEGLSLYINAEPGDGFEGYDIWHNGGPGGPFAICYSKQAADSLISAIEELNALRKQLKENQ